MNRTATDGIKEEEEAKEEEKTIILLTETDSLNTNRRRFST